MTFFLAAGAAPPFLVETATLIVAGAVVAYVGYRLGLVPIVGFLLTGVLIGPHGLGLIQDQEMVDALAEVGVILLLFTIGIEFSLEKLARIQRLIFGGGGFQVVLTTAATAGVLALFGVPWQAGVFTGFLVALSSTAIVLKLLGSRGEQNAPHGQVALGLLIFQDLAIIVMVLLVPMLAGAGGSALDIGWALVKAGLVIAAVLLGARRVMPAVLERVARTCSQELFLLSVIALCFGTAWLTSLAGVSVALGAFLAGLIVSESRFSEHAFGEIMPLQILFSATFFVSVGMLLDVGFLFTNLPLVIGVVVAVLVREGGRDGAERARARLRAARRGGVGLAARAGGGVLVRAGAGRARGRALPGRARRDGESGVHRLVGPADGGDAGARGARCAARPEDGGEGRGGRGGGDGGRGGERARAGARPDREPRHRRGLRALGAAARPRPPRQRDSPRRHHPQPSACRRGRGRRARRRARPPDAGAHARRGPHRQSQTPRPRRR